MGTLTGHDVRLPDDCEHKLPTSCRLSSIRNCCACADERAHSSSYNTYIDGIGLVPRGKRWDRYCWFCKEFWSNRVAATNLLPSQTRIPAVPDQTAFLERWYEFHQGYRTVLNEDGREKRIGVIGERWIDVSPGYLPRTLNELRAGVERSRADLVQIIAVENTSAPAGPSLDETFDRLIAEANDEHEQHLTPHSSVQNAGPQSSSTTAPDRSPSRQITSADQGSVSSEETSSTEGVEPREAQERRSMTLRAELNSMRTGLERVTNALRNIETEEFREELTDLDRDLARIAQSHSLGTVQSLEQATAGLETDERVRRGDAWLSERRRDHQRLERESDALAGLMARMYAATGDLEARTEDLNIDIQEGQQRVERWRQERRTVENSRRVYGTREEMENENWVSPINQMFARAHDRYRAAEEARQENRSPPTWVLSPPVPGGSQTSDQHNIPTDRNHPSAVQLANADRVNAVDIAMQESLEQYYMGLNSTSQPRPPTGLPQSSSSNPPESRATGPPEDSPRLRFSNVVARLRQEATNPVLPVEFPLDPANHDFMRGDDLMQPTTGQVMVGSGLDAATAAAATVNDRRPEPKTEAELLVKLDCKVCYYQVADTACLPCGHVVMCRWCAEQHSAGKASDRTTPADPHTQCPLCRKVVKKRVRIRMG